MLMFRRELRAAQLADLPHTALPSELTQHGEGIFITRGR